MSKRKTIQKNKSKRTSNTNIIRANNEFMARQSEYERNRALNTLAEERAKAQQIADAAMPQLKKLARNQVVGFLTIVSAMALRDGFGFGKKRLEQFFDIFIRTEYILNDSLKSEKEPVTANDLYDSLKAETGLDILEFVRKMELKYANDDKNGTWIAYDIPDKKRMAG